MKYKQLLKYTFLWVFCGLFLIPVTVTAQSESDYIVVAQFPQDDSITFLAIHSDATVTQLGTLPKQFVLMDYQVVGEYDNILVIERPENIVISPDNQYAAFWAARNLYVYRTTGEEVWAFPLETPVSITWSLDDLGFVMTMYSSRFNSANPIGLDYFDMQTGFITELAAPEQVFSARLIKWIDENTIALTVNSQVLITVTRQGRVRTLFQIQSSGAVGAYSNVCEYEWSARLQVFFVVTSCSGGAESIVLNELYEVNTEGNATLILSAPSAYRDERIEQARYSLIGIEVGEDTLYAVTHEHGNILEIRDDEVRVNHLDSSGTWRVLSWQNGVWTQLASGNLSDESWFNHPRISPDGRYLAMGEYPYFPAANPGALIVIDLDTGEIVRRFETSSAISNALIWIDHYRFLYSDSYHAAGISLMTSLAQIVDLSRVPLNGFIIPLDAPIWLPF